METTHAEPSLLARQAADYPRVHRSRRNLLLHAITNPVFLVGNVLAVLAPFFGAWWLALAGLVAMATAMIAQGIGHRGEVEPPLPFRSGAEAVARIFAEQWIAFPRFVRTGGFARAWRAGE